jgi:hypothetical protein
MKKTGDFRALQTLLQAGCEKSRRHSKEDTDEQKPRQSSNN